MKDFYCVMLGKGSMYAHVSRQKGFIGAHFGNDQDFMGLLGDDLREFNQQVRPIYLAAFPEKSKGSVSLPGGYLYSVCKGIKVGDIVLSPNGQGRYLVGEVTGEYRYVRG
jgi:restriction system protein